jgi:hypothetical protein
MRDAKVELAFADGNYVFRLSWGSLIELQEAVGMGPYAILNQLNSDQWKVEQISEIIRLGILGGDKTLHPTKATKLVDRYVKDRPPFENLVLARAVLTVALFGAPDEDENKSAAKGDEIETTDGKLKAKEIYGAGAVMGFTPQQINEMSVWQFMSAFDGYVKHHAPDDGKLTPEEFNELGDFLETVPEG